MVDFMAGGGCSVAGMYLYSMKIVASLPLARMRSDSSAVDDAHLLHT